MAHIQLENRHVFGYLTSMNLKAIIHSAEEGGYWAEVPALPGCVAQGENLDEIKDNLKEAIELWLDATDDLPIDSTRDQVLELAV